MFISGVNDTGEKKEKFWDKIFLNILWRAFLSALYTLRMKFCLFFIFRCKQANIGRTLWSPVSLKPPKNLSPVSLTPLNNFSAVLLTPAINFRLLGYLYRQDSLIAGVIDTAEKFIAGVVDTAEQFIAGVVDTADKHSFANISANFRKKSKWSYWITQGPRGLWFMKKNWDRKSQMSDSL